MGKHNLTEEILKTHEKRRILQISKPDIPDNTPYEPLRVTFDYSTFGTVNDISFEYVIKDILSMVGNYFY